MALPINLLLSLSIYRTKLFFPPVNIVLTTLPNYRYCILRSLITTGSFSLLNCNLMNFASMSTSCLRNITPDYCVMARGSARNVFG